MIKETILNKQLIFLQKMTIDMDLTRGVKFWKKEAVLRILAEWCHQNSHEIHLTPWQCLTREMTLFDVVHLDILHGFDVPNHVLLEYVDRECSAEVVCKLATCYSMTVLKREDRKNKVEYSLHFKTLLLIRQAINYKHPTLESIITAASILMRCTEYKMAAKVLKSSIHECFAELEYYIKCKELFADLFSHKTKNEIQELSDIRLVGYTRRIGVFQSIPTLIRFSLSVCYKYCENEENREDLLKLIFGPTTLLCSNEEYYAFLLLMLEIIENAVEWRRLSFQYKIYRQLVSKKLELIEQQSKARKVVFEKTLLSKQRSDMNWPQISLCSCNVEMMPALMRLAVSSLIHECLVGLMGILKCFQFQEEPWLTYSMSTNADRVYFCQVLIFSFKLDQAISILKDVVEQEGDLSISMVIWPKILYGSRFIDVNLRNELIKSTEAYIVFPTNLYARYLLTIAYSSLGQEENRINNLDELNLLRERYSQVPEFAPMLKIMSIIVVEFI